ncbi:MAG: hypothetical protein K2K12_06045 [Clostridia bacterium]|nr:hypothetical protein [Clostridia bacterium]
MYTGLTGAIKFSSSDSPVAYISGWSLEDKTEIIDSSEFNSATKKSLAGTKSWSATADGVVSFEEGDGQIQLLEAKNKGTKLHLDLYLDISQKTKTYFSGECYIESLSFDLASDGVANISISVVGEGELEYIVNRQPGKGNAEDRKITFAIGEDGHLIAQVPERLKSHVEHKENGEFTIIV